MKPLTLACFALFFLGVAALLAQMWLHLWSHETFIKLLITDACFFAIVFVMAFLIKETKESKKIGTDDL